MSLSDGKRKKTNSEPGLGVDERTPKRIKAVEPDLTIVVGGEEFYHYKVLLCSTCDFFDTLLSTQMKESEDSRIEFPDKNPKDWLAVYSFLDPTQQSPELEYKNATQLIAFFDYLGMKELVAKCDTVIANHFGRPYPSIRRVGDFEDAWNVCKSLPCPNAQTELLLKLNSLQRNGRFFGWEQVKILKRLILDDVGGDRVWESVKSSGQYHFIPSIQEMGRVELAENPMFEYFLISNLKELVLV